MSTKILNAATTAISSSTYKFSAFPANVMLTQVQITGGTATVLIEGTLDVRATTPVWATLSTVTSSSVVSLPPVPGVRATISAIAGATVNVWVSV